MGERRVRNAEVMGSNPTISTIIQTHYIQWVCICICHNILWFLSQYKTVQIKATTGRGNHPPPVVLHYLSLYSLISFSIGIPALTQNKNNRLFKGGKLLDALSVIFPQTWQAHCFRGIISSIAFYMFLSYLLPR